MLLLLHLLLATSLLWQVSCSMDIPISSMFTGKNSTTRRISTRDLSGTFSNSIGDYYAACIDWSATQNINALTSTITATFYFKKIGNGYAAKSTGSTPMYRIFIDGKEYSGFQGFTFFDGCAVGTTQTIGTVPHTVSHNSDGSRSVGISAELIGQTSFGGTPSVSGTAVLDTIPIPVTVYFDGNGGTTSESSTTVKYGKPYGELPEPTRTGYNFTGWYTELSGGSLVTSTTTVTNASHHTIYAHWEAHEYTVTYDVNGGDELTPKIKDVTYNSTYGELETPTRDGYNFTGWYTDKDGGIKIESNTNVTTAEDHTIYAHWEANYYSVTLDGRGGYLDTLSVEVKYGDVYGELPEPIKEGYTFLWWYIKETGEKITSDTTVSISSDHTLIAGWNINKVTFNASGCDIDKSSVNVTYEDTYGELPKPEKDGYTFLGWFTEEVGGDEITSNTIVGIVIDHTIYARWEASNYTVTLDGRGGYLDEQTIEVTYDSFYGEIPEPIKEGYTFLWWYIKETREKITSDTTVSISGDHTLIAGWNINKVTFNATGGYLDKSSVNVTYGNTYGELPKPERDGYTFLGWFTEEVGDDEVTSNTIVNIVIDHTLYAHWSVNHYTVFFNATGGYLDKPSMEVEYNGYYEGLPEPTKEGYTFLWWHIEETDINITSETKVTIPKNHTLYARWSANTYTVTFDFDNGAVAEVRAFEYNTEIIYPVNPTKEGYIFFGWDNNITKMPAHNFTTKAYWVDATSQSSYVRITFSTVGLTDNKINEIIKKYSDSSNFVIVDASKGDNDETIIIVKFNDVSEAKNFVETIGASSDNDKQGIKSVSFIDDKITSFSFVVHPTLFFL